MQASSNGSGVSCDHHGAWPEANGGGEPHVQDHLRGISTLSGQLLCAIYSHYGMTGRALLNEMTCVNINEIQLGMPLGFCCN